MGLRRYWPLAIILLASLLFIGWRLQSSGWQAAALAEVGSRYGEGEAEGSEGYDGQFVLFMAQELRPEAVAPKLDVPAYRYQRILLPLLARLVALGRSEWVPWSLLLVNLSAHLLGAWSVCRILIFYDQWPGYTLHYGLWVGLLVGVGAVLHEPLAYGLVALALYLRLNKKRKLAILLTGLSVFAKETTLPFLLAFVLVDIFDRKIRHLIPYYALFSIAYAAWQGWLWLTFGQPGIGSGGAGATPFEWIPFMGFIRIATVDIQVFLVFLLLFGPGVILPTIWAIIRAARDLLQNVSRLYSWLILLNAAILMALPFSTFREPLGLVRLASGLVLAILVYSAQHSLRRPLVYGWFWLAYIPFIF